LDPDFRAYFASNQARLKTLPQQPPPHPPHDSFGAHPPGDPPPRARESATSARGGPSSWRSRAIDSALK
jgi:hypothetical protein